MRQQTSKQVKTGTPQKHKEQEDQETEMLRQVSRYWLAHALLGEGCSKESVRGRPWMPTGHQHLFIIAVWKHTCVHHCCVTMEGSRTGKGMTDLVRRSLYPKPPERNATTRLHTTIKLIRAYFGEWAMRDAAPDKRECA